MTDSDDDDDTATELPEGLGEPQGSEFEKDHDPEEGDSE